MKSVLASFKPKYCELIASGRKTAELRKNCPKIDVPFKVYMYQTKGRWIYKILEWLGLYQGKVIGEFICKHINTAMTLFEGTDIPIFHQAVINASCLSNDEVEKYGNGKTVYAWHISDLIIYDEPKDLDEFEKPCSHDCKNCKYWYSGSFIDYEPPCCEWEDCFITHPPQSWYYVEEKEE